MRKVLVLVVLISMAGLAALAAAETIQKGNLRVAFDAKLSPQRLPRAGAAPVAVSVATKIAAVGGGRPAQLKRIAIAINAHGKLDATGLPVCEIAEIQPATSAKALAACRGALVGQGHLSAQVALARQGVYPSEGRLLAFNGTYEGRPAILAHVYGEEPVPTSVTLPFVISESKGTFATTLTATFPAADNNFVTGIDLDLHRTYTFKGQKRSYASASCPAPKGFSGASFPFAKASYVFAGGRKLSSTLRRSCGVRG